MTKMKFAVFRFIFLAVALAILSEQSSADRLAKLEEEVANLKAELAKYSAYDLAWQSLHMAAAAACRGSTSSGGSGPWDNAVMVRNTASGETCSQICARTSRSNCDGEVSIYGRNGKATQNGEMVGTFYNYHCGESANGGSEVDVANEDIMNRSGSNHYFSFCCCRK